MTESISAADFLPERRTSLAALRRAASACRGCHLYEDATLADHSIQTELTCGCAAMTRIDARLILEYCCSCGHNQSVHA